MWRIVRNLYLGDAKDARDLPLLEGMGITHILNCAIEVPCWHRGRFRYRHLKMYDPDPEFTSHIPAICKFIHRGRRSGAVLVHCKGGLSRSPSAILAYLCWRKKTLDEAIELLQRRVGEAELFLPAPDFLEQIELYFESAEGDAEDG